MSALSEFRHRLHREWLEPYCNDRGYDPAGFVSSSLDKLEESDAYDFMDAVDHGLVTYEKGAFVAACSRAKEYIFWEGLRTGVPRRLTLWLEPIITIAGLRRLQRDFGWPSDRLGMQSSTWAFDFVGYAADQEMELIVCEVKRTRREVDSLLELMALHAATPAESLAEFKGAERNALKKVIGLRRSGCMVFWALGPDHYGKIFRVSRENSGRMGLQPSDASALQLA